MRAAVRQTVLFGGRGGPRPVSAVINDDHDLVVNFSGPVLLNDAAGWSFGDAAVPTSANAAGNSVTFAFDPNTFDATTVGLTVSYDATNPTANTTDANAVPVRSFANYPVFNSLARTAKTADSTTITADSSLVTADAA